MPRRLVKLPATIPGLIRPTSPLLDARGRSWVALTTAYDENGHPWVTLTDATPRLRAASPSGVREFEARRVWLDLTNATGRLHAAEWVVAQMKPQQHARGVNAPMHTERLAPGSARIVCIQHRFGGGAVRLDGYCLECGTEFHLGGEYSFRHQEYLLPYVRDEFPDATGYRRGRYLGEDEIGRLKPKDERLLPDGSRWVDAEAARLLVLACIRRDDLDRR